MALSKLGYSLLCMGFGGFTLTNAHTSEFGWVAVWALLLSGVVLTGVLSE